MTSNKTDKAQEEIRNFLRNCFAQMCERDAEELRHDGEYRKARIMGNVAKQIRLGVMKSRVEQAGNYWSGITGGRTYVDDGLGPNPIFGTATSPVTKTASKSIGYDNTKPNRLGTTKGYDDFGL